MMSHATKAERIGTLGNAPLYRITMSDGRKIAMTVPPRECPACEGFGQSRGWACAECNGTGDETEAR